jgi:hypothetical protein
MQIEMVFQQDLSIVFLMSYRRYPANSLWINEGSVDKTRADVLFSAETSPGTMP